MLEPPTPETYTTTETLVHATNLHARGQGYAIVKQHSKKKGRR